jgi:hypothetical protein
MQQKERQVHFLYLSYFAVLTLRSSEQIKGLSTANIDLVHGSSEKATKICEEI